MSMSVKAILQQLHTVLRLPVVQTASLSQHDEDYTNHSVATLLKLIPQTRIYVFNGQQKNASEHFYLVPEALTSVTC
jgi:hypothetical protein